MKQLPFANGTTVEVVKDGLHQLLASKVNSLGREDKDDAFFVANLGDIVLKHKLWQEQLPRVEPHYAVKCNDDPPMLQVLAQLGTGFDCASKSEIQKILDLGVGPERIVYANPCKQASHIRFAAKHGVHLMTFDNEPELHKVKTTSPDARLLLRIAPPDGTKCQCQLGMKYGCGLRDVPKMLKVARELQLNVIGISFHVGSGCYDARAFSAAVASSRTAFDMGAEAGFRFSLLDIGGGFPGQKSAKISFEEICAVLRPALDLYFPESSGVRIISEPGRFYSASAYTLATNIIAKRCVSRDGTTEDEVTGNDEPAYMYYLNDGVYGSFNCILYDHSEPEPILLEEQPGATLHTTSLWGPTCDGLDCIKNECLLPQLDIGDWIVFKDMGAYTMCAASNFNGMPKPRCYYVALEAQWSQMNWTPAIAATFSGKKMKKQNRQRQLSHSEVSCAGDGQELDLSAVFDLLNVQA
eukprot:GHVU01027679.1.p1 GENE.GHVU01027679.1~~GHVU01027679.1.p1  ORF type:complete len:468 (+),score=67.10 GHVU01027679.1:253-1656(+)